MTLADYCLPGADPDLQEPLAGRLLGLLEHFAGRLMILSGRRSWGEQQRLYELYLAGGNLAAKPGTSLHEKGLAADLALFDGLTWRLVHAEAEIRGLRFPIAGELWHTEVDPAWVAPVLPEVDDMTKEELKEEFAAAIGAQIPAPGQEFAGLVCVELAEGPTTTKLYPLASAISYIHKEGKYPSVAR